VIVRDLFHRITPKYDIRGFALDRFTGAEVHPAETNIV
jgi:hypothetical protein